MILTINLNYILEPCINLYKECISELPSSRNAMWNNIMQRLDLDRHLSINEENLAFIETILNEAAKYSPRAAYADNPSAILTALGDEFGYNQQILPNNLINIDHFHDLSYTPEQNLNLDLYDDTDATSWVNYLYKHGGLNNYIWIGNENSQKLSEEECLKIPNYHQITKNEFNYDLLKDCDFIFISGASSWIPPKYDNYLIAVQQYLISLYNKDNLHFYSETFNQAKQYQNFEIFK